MNRGVLLFILALLMLFLPVASAHAQPIICGDPSPVITFIGGGRHLLLSSANTTRIWDARGHEIFVLRNTTLRAVSPDGLTLALQHPDNTIRLWSLDGRQLAVLTGHHSPVATVIYSPDGRLVLTIAAGESARLWHADGRFITTLVLDTDHDMPVAAAFSSDSRRLALAAADTVRLYNREGNRLLTLNAPASPVMSISFGTENNLILAAGAGGARLWDAAGNVMQTFNTEDEQLIDAQLSPDGTHLITTSAQRMTRLWSTQGTLIVSFPGTARFTSDGIQLLTIAAGGDMRLRDLNGWTIISFDGLDGNVADVGFSPDGERLLAMSDRGTLGIWSRDGRQIASERFALGWRCAGMRAAFTPDGTRAATIGFGQAPQIWDLVTVSRAPLPTTRLPWWLPAWLSFPILLGLFGLWLVAIRMRAPADHSQHTPLTVVKIWPALVAIVALTLPPIAAFAPYTLPVGGLVLAHLLWPVVRGLLGGISTRRWLLGSSLGWLIGYTLAEIGRMLLFPHGIYLDTRLMIVPCAGVGMACGQWYVLRRLFPGAHWLIAAALVAWPAGAALTATEYAGMWGLSALVQGLITGAVGATAFVWLLLEPEESEPR